MNTSRHSIAAFIASAAICLLAVAPTLAQTDTLELPTKPPPNRVLDTAGLLGSEMETKLGDYLVERFQKDGTLVYFVSFNSLPEGIYPAQRAKELGNLWFGITPTPTTFGAVLVYASDTEKVGVTLTSAASREGGSAMGRKVVLAAQERISSYNSLAEALHESTLDLEYSIRKLRDENRQSRSVRVPITLGIAGAVVIAVLFGIYLTIRGLRMQNFFGRAYVMPHSDTVQRLGGSQSGGHSVVISWEED